MKVGARGGAQERPFFMGRRERHGTGEGTMTIGQFLKKDAKAPDGQREVSFRLADGEELEVAEVKDRYWKPGTEVVLRRKANN